MIFIVYAVMRSRQMAIAGDGLIGSGLAPTRSARCAGRWCPIGSVYAGGEEWTARSADDRPLQRGVHVKVRRAGGVDTVVEPTEASGSPAK
jgi:membrane-bound ClpP family serine protease